MTHPLSPPYDAGDNERWKGDRDRNKREMTHVATVTNNAGAAAPRAIVIMNARSGEHGDDDARGVIEAALRNAGWQPEVLTAPEPAALAGLAQRARDARPALVVVAGGDGTVNVVANAVAETGISFAVIPMGTFNYFARLHAIPDDIAAASRLSPGDAPINVSVGEVNGQVFLNNFSIGFYTSIIEARERDKKIWGRHRLVALVSALWVALKPAGRRRVTLQTRTGETRMRVAMIFVGANALQFEDANLPLANELALGKLGVVILKAAGPWKLFKAALGMAMGTAHELEGVTIEAHEELRIAIRRPQTRVVIDGEIVRLRTPLAIRFRPAALRLLRPQAAPAATSDLPAATGDESPSPSKPTVAPKLS
ncbi:MAG: diacylglycerol kinase family protein [Casimicrobiaceae bacterium]